MKKLSIVLLLIAVTAIMAGPEALMAAEVPTHGGDILYTKPVKSVLFSHKLHVEEKGLACDMCHPKLFELSALKAQEKSDFTMAALYKGKYCGACHDGKTAFASNTQCARCHGGVKEAAALEGKPKPVKQSLQGPKGVIAIGAVSFSHGTHSKADCSDCHSGMFRMKKGASKITFADHSAGKLCYSCHNGKKAFASSDCAKCHATVPAPKADLVYKIKGAAPVNFSHTFHTKAFGCKDCHPGTWAMKKGGNRMNMDGMYQGKFCGTCHNGKIAFEAMQCDKCHKESKK